MDQEQVLLVVRQQAIARVSNEAMLWYEGTTPVSGWCETWHLRRLHRWQRLYFDRGRLRGWIDWNNFLEMFP